MDVISDTTAANESAGKPAEASLTQAVRWRVPVVSVPHATAGQARNPSLPTFVGLIILILTFFIVLTSISIRDKTKSDSAIASVQEAFSGNAVTTEDVPERKDDEIAREYIEGLTHRIQSLVPLMGGKKGPASDHQVLWLPAELAFADGATMAPQFPTVLREVVHSLSGVPQRLTPHIEMRLCAAEPSNELRDRALAIGAALAAEKAPLKQFSIGIAACDPKAVGIAVALAPAAEPLPANAEEQP
ncbi:MAG TPA: flagellar motor protein MotB [Dongiaceae bacterium]|nr:flagellar motor protein MotB [Dongiaceae bacterium]